MKTYSFKDYPLDEKIILEYLAQRQGDWTSLWSEGFAKDRNVREAMPPNTPELIALTAMRKLYRKGFVGGCTCGCRGDFEITDAGLAYINKPRTNKYSGY